MAYQSKYKGQEVEEILDNSLLKKEQILTDDEKRQVKENLGIKDRDLSDYATKEEVEEAISKIPTSDVSGQINEHNNDESAHPHIQSELEEVKKSKQDVISDLANIREGATKGATAIQEEQYKGTIAAVDTDESVDEPNIPSGSYDDTEIKAQIKANADAIAENKADADEKLSELGSEIKDSIITPSFSDGVLVASGKFDEWWGFARIDDLEYDCILNSIDFGRPTKIAKTWRFRLSRKVRDEQGEISSLSVIPNSEISFVQDVGVQVVNLPNIFFGKDYVWELYFDTIKSDNDLYYKSGSATKPFIKFIDGVPSTGSMYNINATLLYGNIAKENKDRIETIEKKIYTTGKNLFDKSKIIDGYVNSIDGVVMTDNTNYPKAKCSNRIPVESGKYYTISGRTDTRGIVGYDSEGSRVQIVSGSWSLPFYNGSFLIPDDVVEIQFTCILYAESIDTLNIQLEKGDIATNYEEYRNISINVALESEKEKLREIGKIANKNAEYINRLEESEKEKYKIPYLVPNYKIKGTNVSGSFNKWYGFSTEKDLDSDGYLNKIIFSGTSTSDIRFNARISKKVRDSNGVITGLETISDVFVVTLLSGKSEIETPQLYFKKDYVLELFYGDIKAGLITYVSNAATGETYVRYIDQVASVGSMWDVNVEILIPETAEIKSKKSIKILSIGNSFAEDAFSYVPFILRDSCQDIDLTLGILYYGGCSLEMNYNHFIEKSEVYAYRKITSSDNAWTTPNNKASIQQSLADEDWDIIVFQQNGSAAGDYTTFQPYLNNLIIGLQSLVKKPVRFGWHMVEAYDSNFEASVTRFNSYCVAAKKVIDETLIDIVFPSATGMQNARTTSLQTLGDAGNLMHTSNHAQEGIPCYCLALPNVLVILGLCGYGFNGIYGDKNIPTSSWITARAIPNQNGASVGATEENCKLAQIAGVFAYKKPYEITDLKTLGYE